jgi:hypothetical protein
MISSRLLLTSDLPPTPTSAPTTKPKTNEGNKLEKEINQAKKKTTGIHKKRTEDRKAMIERGDRIKDLQALVLEKNASIAYGQDERRKLSGAYDELERQFEQVKKNPGVHGLHFFPTARQQGQGDRELESSAFSKQ